MYTGIYIFLTSFLKLSTQFDLMKKLSLREIKRFVQSYTARSHVTSCNLSTGLHDSENCHDAYSIDHLKLAVVYLGSVLSVRAKSNK